MKVYKCCTCKKVYPTFFFTENTDLLPICECGDDLFLTNKTDYYEPDDTRSESMMLYGY